MSIWIPSTDFTKSFFRLKQKKEQALLVAFVSNLSEVFGILWARGKRQFPPYIFIFIKPLATVCLHTQTFQVLPPSTCILICKISILQLVVLCLCVCVWFSLRLGNVLHCYFVWVCAGVSCNSATTACLYYSY